MLQRLPAEILRILSQMILLRTGGPDRSFSAAACGSGADADAGGDPDGDSVSNGLDYEHVDVWSRAPVRLGVTVAGGARLARFALVCRSFRDIAAKTLSCALDDDCRRFKSALAHFKRDMDCRRALRAAASPEEREQLDVELYECFTSYEGARFIQHQNAAVELPMSRADIVQRMQELIDAGATTSHFPDFELSLNLGALERPFDPAPSAAAPPSAWAAYRNEVRSSLRTYAMFIHGCGDTHEWRSNRYYVGNGGQPLASAVVEGLGSGRLGFSPSPDYRFVRRICFPVFLDMLFTRLIAPEFASTRKILFPAVPSRPSGRAISSVEDVLLPAVLLPGSDRELNFAIFRIMELGGVSENLPTRVSSALVRYRQQHRDIEHRIGGFCPWFARLFTGQFSRFPAVVHYNTEAENEVLSNEQPSSLAYDLVRIVSHNLGSRWSKKRLELVLETFPKIGRWLLADQSMRPVIMNLARMKQRKFLAKLLASEPELARQVAPDLSRYCHSSAVRGCKQRLIELVDSFL